MASGYGYRTQNIPRGQDAGKGFRCCCLCGQPGHKPMVTPDGFLFGPEAIQEYILPQIKIK